MPYVTIVRVMKDRGRTFQSGSERVRYAMNPMVRVKGLS